MEFINKIILIVTAFLALAFIGCKKENMGDCFKSVGSQTMQKRDLPAFNRMVVEHNVDVVLVPDTEEFVIVRCGEHLIGLIKTEVNNGELTITNDNKCNWVRKLSTPIKAEVHLKSINRLYFKGSGTITSTDTLRSDNFRLEAYDASGNVDIIVRNGWNEVVQHTGNADLKVSGVAPANTMYSGGNGFIDCKGLITPNSYVRHRGTGNFFVYANTELDVNIELIGDVYYSGSPTTINKYITGTGKLIAQ